MTGKLLVTAFCLVLFLAGFSQAGHGKKTLPPLMAYYTRLPFNDQQFTGRYADIIVRIAGKGALVFSREYSYQPYWQPVHGEKQAVKRWIARKGDGPEARPDNHNISSGAAIVEKSDSLVKVHWRYAQDITLPSYTDFFSAYNLAGNPASFYAEYADEYFTIHKDGTALREIQQGTYKLSDWQDASNTIREALVLAAGGMRSAKIPSPGRAKPVTVTGEAIKQSQVAGAVLNFPLDEGASTGGATTTEAVSKTAGTIEGVQAYWRKGVSGTCLSFDSYSNAVEFAGDKLPLLQNAFSLEAWIAPQEYPFNEAPVLDHLKDRSGYFFGLNANGALLLKIGDGDSVYTFHTVPVPLYSWSHVAVSFTGEAVIFFINGREVDRIKTGVKFTDAVQVPLYLGAAKNRWQYPAGAERDITKSFRTAVVFSGLLDEIQVYNRPLSGAEVAASYAARKPASLRVLQPWLLPESTSSGVFGAHCTTLRYSPEWDGLWRVGSYADIVVNFEGMPWRYVFWRGTRYLPSLVTGSGKTSVWSSDQGPEHFNGQCFEHMSDMQCRFSKIRLIQNSPARVVVHWRNASGSIGYQWPGLNKDGWGVWTDEYWTIYPDGIAVRHQELHNGPGVVIIEMNQNEILHHPMQTTADVLKQDALTLGDADGNLVTFDRRKPDSAAVPRLVKNMQYVNLNSDTRQFQIGEPGMKIDVDLFRDVWWYGWNHYPAQLIPSDGTQVIQYDRPASSCVATFREVRHPLNANSVEAYTIYGLTNQQPEALTALNRAWNFAPAVTDASGVTSSGFNKRTRAFEFTATRGPVSFVIHASAASPVYHPAFVIKNWAAGNATNITVKMNGSTVTPSGYRSGIETNTEGGNDLVIWMPVQLSNTIRMEITP